MHQAFGDDSFRMLVAVILSQRATDAMTIPVAKKLFEVAGTPKDILRLTDHELESLIHSIGFYHQKTKALKIIHFIKTNLIPKWPAQSAGHFFINK